MHAGGFTEIRKIAALADMYSIPVAPHNPGGPICTAAAMHLAASIPNFFILEQMEPQRAMRDRASTRSDPLRERTISCCPKVPGSGSSPTSRCCRNTRSARSRAPSARARCIAKEEIHAQASPVSPLRSPPASRAAAAAQQPIVLQWQTANLTESQYEPVWKATIAEFEAANPGVKIEPVLVARKDHWTKFVAAAQAKKAPCIVTVDLTTAAYNGYLLPLDKFFERRAGRLPPRVERRHAVRVEVEGTALRPADLGRHVRRDLQPRPRRPRPGSTPRSRRRPGRSTWRGRRSSPATTSGPPRCSAARPTPRRACS